MRGTCLRLGAKVSGSQNDLLTPWHDGRADIIPVRYLPVLLGGKLISHVSALFTPLKVARSLEQGDFPGHTLARSLEQGLFRSVQNLAKPSSRSAAVLRHACVAYKGQLDLVVVLSHYSKGTRSQGGGPQVCRKKVVRASSQPQGMFLHFETRRSVVWCG